MIKPQHQQLHFTKMHGLGNDFVIVYAIDQHFNFKQDDIQKLSNRFIGIGFDQLLVIEPSQSANFFCRILNADGSEAEQCGNGLRCVAKYVYEKNLIADKIFTIATKAGIFSVEIINTDEVSVTLGKASIQQQDLHLNINNQDLVLTQVSLGNPHVILQVESLLQMSLGDVGKQISLHPVFEHGVNVGFVEVVNNKHIRLRTYERGAGETLACGSNACAAVTAGIANGLLANRVRVEFEYGSLWIEQKANGEIVMTGPAAKVYEGIIDTM